MRKKTLGPKPLVYPMPAFLIGSPVNDKPNFMVAAWSGIVNSEPPMIGVSLQPHRHTLEGVREHGTFSVNVPSEDMAAQTDFCGIYSGSNTNKIEACGFSVFHGDLKTAPMIGQCPANLECRLNQTLKLPSHILVIGEIVQVYVNEDCMDQSLPDPEKIKPLIYASGQEKRYYGLGRVVAPAFSVGKSLKK